MSSEGPGQALFAFVRHWSRRSAGDNPTVAERGRLVIVTEAVTSLRERDIAATVNAIAHEIGIDQSGASRMITSATVLGYLSMEPSQTDGRRREASVTAKGRSMLSNAHRWQEETFEQLTIGWSDQRRHELQKAMAELMDRSYALGD